MNTKSVYQLDEEGYLVGQTIAFESPLEPGVFHIPRGCIDTDIELPELKFVDDRIKWSGTEWIVCNERIEREKEEELKKQEEERIKLEQERLRLEEIQKIEDEKKRQEELQKLEEEKQKQAEQKRIEDTLKRKEELLQELKNIEYLQQIKSQPPEPRPADISILN